MTTTKQNYAKSKILYNPLPPSFIFWLNLIVKRLHRARIYGCYDIFTERLFSLFQKKKEAHFGLIIRKSFANKKNLVILINFWTHQNVRQKNHLIMQVDVKKWNLLDQISSKLSKRGCFKHNSPHKSLEKEGRGGIEVQ